MKIKLDENVHGDAQGALAAWGHDVTSVHDVREVTLCSDHWQTWPAEDKAKRRAAIAAMSYDEYVGVRTRVAFERYGADKTILPPAEVLDALYSDRLITFDEDR